MAKKNVDALALEVATIINHPDQATTDAFTWVNRAYAALANRVDFTELHSVQSIVTVVSQPNYAYPSNYFSTISLRDTSEQRKLRQLSTGDFDALDSSISGLPTHYSLFDQLYLWPTPSDVRTLSHRCRLTPAAMATGDFYIFPEVWEGAIVLGAVALGFEHWNEFQLAAAYEAKQRNYIKLLVTGAADSLTDRNEAVAPIVYADY